MEFLDKIGLNSLWKKIKTNFGTFVSDAARVDVIINYSTIPFKANHQIVNMDSEIEENQKPINLFYWFEQASRGGIIEIIPTVNVRSDIYCFDPNDVDMNSHIYMMENATDGPTLKQIPSIPASYNTYLRLIKVDNDKLVVACKIN